MTYWEAFVATDMNRKFGILFGKLSFSEDNSEMDYDFI